MAARPLRILVIDSEFRQSVGGSLCRGFQALGHNAVFFDQAPWVGGWVDESRVKRLVRTALRPASDPALNVALLTAVFAQKPDFVLVAKGFHIFPETLDAMRRATKLLLCYHSDDLSNPLNMNPAMRRSLPLWDVVFSPRGFAAPDALAQGVRRFEPLWFGYDPQLSYPAPNSAPPEPGIDQSVVFIGAWTEDRAELFETLSPRLPLRVWGGNWARVSQTARSFPALRRRQLIGEALCATLTQAGVSLALVRKANRDRHVMRTFEIPACAGFMLAERTEDHLALFDEGTEAVFFSTAEELADHAEHYLVDTEARRRMAAAGHRRLLAGGHRYQDRAARIVEVVREML